MSELLDRNPPGQRPKTRTKLDSGYSDHDSAEFLRELADSVTHHHDKGDTNGDLKPVFENTNSNTTDIALQDLRLTDYRLKKSTENGDFHGLKKDVEEKDENRLLQKSEIDNLKVLNNTEGYNEKRTLLEVFDEKRQETHPQVVIEVDKGATNPGSDVDDWSDEDDEDDDRAGCVSRTVVNSRRHVAKAMGYLLAKTSGYLTSIVLLLGYLAYFIAAMCYRFGDEGSHRLLVCTILGVIIISRHHIYRGSHRLFIYIYRSKELSPRHQHFVKTFRFFLRWALYGGVTGLMAWIIIDQAIKDPSNLRSVPGMVIILLICFLMSTKPSKVNYHTIIWSLGLQFILALFVLKWQFGKDCVMWVQTRFEEFFGNSAAGSAMLFGPGYNEHYFVFGALPLLFFTNGIMTLLYYCGAMQFVVNSMGSFLNFILDTTPVESMAVAAGTFMEGITALTAFRPYLGGLTKSQLFLVITSCFSSLGSAYLAILAKMGISIDLIIGAMLLSAPATFTVCKLIMPETSRRKGNQVSDVGNEKSKYTNVLDAFQAGAVEMMAVVGNLIVSIFAFVSLISWINTTFTWFGERVGIENLSIEMIASYVLYPIPLAMGVEINDCRRVAMLYGYRLGSSNIISFLKLGEMRRNKGRFFEYMKQTGGNGTVTYIGDDIILNQWNETLPFGFLSERSEAIITYALSGFSSLLSVAMLLGFMAAFIPKRRKWLSEIAFVALVAGNLTNCLTGCFACLFY
ncbi:sodium/nucleoside cotransporter 1-like [Physella acuta]|uniref:sodium/nucleoside cotransporter 1-like n=1 Tax=Physella acuta TaxID=109671 RepID=UPI0027DC4D8B|nr:sodium/nucleoside cotransporter 1-like [Physella acuta]